MIHITKMPTVDPQIDRDVPGENRRAATDARCSTEGALTPLVSAARS